MTTSRGPRQAREAWGKGRPVQGTAPSLRGVGRTGSFYSQAPVATGDDEAAPVTAASSTSP